MPMRAEDAFRQPLAIETDPLPARPRQRTHVEP
jgi:hypothetical protein